MGDAPVWWHWTGLTVGLSPIAAAIMFIAIHPSGSDDAMEYLRKMFAADANRWRLFGWECATAVLGLLNGMLCVPQHTA